MKSPALALARGRVSWDCAIYQLEIAGSIALSGQSTRALMCLAAQEGLMEVSLTAAAPPRISILECAQRRQSPSARNTDGLWLLPILLKRQKLKEYFRDRLEIKQLLCDADFV
ncbi:hypothetical protein NDU88_011097 [Pleurodeles waltl]|uniref:Uncharacterized protein n=1 Tax=Pleurodeles waltl TaxID=8319 RepID=A0AAV7QZ43_PLEWA|nr:hypothetical protein NDU88_011097 [Pleurodeles waltl]